MALHTGRDTERGDPAPTTASMFLGSLRSELDLDDEVAPNFAKLRDAMRAGLSLYRVGRLTKRELAERLSALVAEDGRGAEWTVGATTGSWYRRVGARWMSSAAPAPSIGDALPGDWNESADFLLSGLTAYRGGEGRRHSGGDGLPGDPGSGSTADSGEHVLGDVPDSSGSSAAPPEPVTSEDAGSALRGGGYLLPEPGESSSSASKPGIPPKAAAPPVDDLFSRFLPAEEE